MSEQATATLHAPCLCLATPCIRCQCVPNQQSPSMSNGQDGQICNVAGACSTEPDEVGKESNGRQEQYKRAHPNWKQPHLLMEPLMAAFQYIHQKFLVLTSAFQCDLQAPRLTSFAMMQLRADLVHLYTLVCLICNAFNPMELPTRDSTGSICSDCTQTQHFTLPTFPVNMQETGTLDLLSLRLHYTALRSTFHATRRTAVWLSRRLVPDADTHTHRTQYRSRSTCCHLAHAT